MQEGFIEIREDDTNEIRVVNLPLDVCTSGMYKEEEEEEVYKVGDEVEVYWDKEQG